MKMMVSLQKYCSNYITGKNSKYHMSVIDCCVAITPKPSGLTIISSQIYGSSIWAGFSWIVILLILPGVIHVILFVWWLN